MLTISGTQKLEMQIKLFKDHSVGVVYSNFWIKNEISGKIKKLQTLNYQMVW